MQQGHRLRRCAVSSERDKALGELRQQAGGIDPALDQAAGYVRAIDATRALARSQGQVMSAALENNHTLYHTNKALKGELSEVKGELRSVRSRNAQLERELAATQAYVGKLEQAGGDRYRALYEHTRQVLVQSLHDQLDPDQLKARLDDMKAQAEEIAKDPTMLTPEQIEKLKEET